jgi:hypothetical protein
MFIFAILTALSIFAHDVVDAARHRVESAAARVRAVVDHVAAPLHGPDVGDFVTDPLQLRLVAAGYGVASAGRVAAVARAWGRQRGDHRADYFVDTIVRLEGRDRVELHGFLVTLQVLAFSAEDRGEVLALLADVDGPVDTETVVQRVMRLQEDGGLRGYSLARAVVEVAARKVAAEGHFVDEVELTTRSVRQ